MSAIFTIDLLKELLFYKIGGLGSGHGIVVPT